MILGITARKGYTIDTDTGMLCTDIAGKVIYGVYSLQSYISDHLKSGDCFYMGNIKLCVNSGFSVRGCDTIYTVSSDSFTVYINDMPVFETLGVKGYFGRWSISAAFAYMGHYIFILSLNGAMDLLVVLDEAGGIVTTKIDGINAYERHHFDGDAVYARLLLSGLRW